jgi:hypothetical protein
MRRCALLLIFLLLLAACGVREPSETSADTPQGNAPLAVDCAAALQLPNLDAAAPTIAPAPTAPPVTPAPPASPAPTEAVTPPALAYDDLAATAIAVATAQPFPTAAAPSVQGGQPAEARGKRGGLSLTVALASDQLLAGEAAQATLTLRNDGAEPLIIAGDGRQLGWLLLLDARGGEPEPWPWVEASRPGGPFFAPLAPGTTLSTTLTLQTPSAAAANEAYALWAATRFARIVPDTDGPDNLWLHLEAGPLPLTLVPPRPDQQLTATLALDRSGYELEARGADGQPVPGAWGAMEADFSVAGEFDAFTSRPLRSGSGAWADGWDAQFQAERAQIVARAWVAAPGYVTAALTQTLSSLPLTPAEVARSFGSSPPPCRQQFADPAAASASLHLPVARLAGPPAAVAMLGVQAEVVPGWMTITTQYVMPNQVWLDLTQRATTAQYESAGWGEARYDPEAQQVQIGSASGYLVRHYGIWTLNWKLGTTGLELRAPASGLAAAELVQLATTVEVAP